MDDDSIEALLEQKTNLFALQKGRGRERLAEDGDTLFGQFSGRWIFGSQVKVLFPDIAADRLRQKRPGRLVPFFQKATDFKGRRHRSTTGLQG